MTNSFSNRHVARGKHAGTFESYLIFLVTFAVFLAAALLARVLPFGWRPFPQGRHGQRSVIEEAREAASSCSSFAFMG